MRFRLNLSNNRNLVYGHDHALGWFASILNADEDHELAGYDKLRAGYDHERPLDGLLRWIAAEVRIYSIEELEEALVILADGERVPERLRVVVEVIGNLRSAGDGSG